MKLPSDQDCFAIVHLINSLREDEGNSVMLFNDNPDFDGPNCVIEVNGDWTNWSVRRFEGDSLKACLLAADNARLQKAFTNSRDAAGE